MKVTNVFLFSALVRALLIIYGHWHDQNFEVRYTDIDYEVFSDAAEHVFNGKTPYQRATYRYTPLLAFLMLPNSWLHKCFGKVFFSVCDLIVGVLIIKILDIEQKFPCSDPKTNEAPIFNTKSPMLFALVWLFNPLTVTISTRGNAESFQAMLVLTTLLCVLKRQYLLGGIFYGLAVHFKLYPVIYSLPILLFIANKNNTKDRTQGKIQYIVSLISVVIKTGFSFVCATAFTLAMITLILYQWYGMAFINETYLYHLTRKDIKHNFSPYFYVLYLTTNSSISKYISLLAFMPQAITVFAIGVKYSSRLSLACFLQTFAFVTFNKVCTSQYFVWYLCLLPLALPYINLKFRNSCWMLFLWISSQGVWLFFAYLLEFQGMQTFLLVWLASLLFFVVNVYVLLNIMSNIKIEENVNMVEKKKR